MARVKGTGTSPLTGTYGLLSFGVTDFDSGGIFSAAAPTQLVAPIPGVYRATATAPFDAHATGDREVEFRVNDAAVGHGLVDVPANPVGVTALTTTDLIRLDAGGTVKVLIWQSSGVAIGVTGSLSLEWVAAAP